MATPSARPPAFNPEQNMFNQLIDGAPLLGDLTEQARAWYTAPRPADSSRLAAKFGDARNLYREVMAVLNDTHARQEASLEIIGQIRTALNAAPPGSQRAHQLETLLRYLIRSMSAGDRVNTALQGINPRRSQERKDGRGLGGSSEMKSLGGGRKSKTRKAAKRGKKRKGGYKFTRAANSRRSLRMKTRKLKSLTQKSPKKKQKKKHGKKHGKKHDKKSKSRKARQGKHHKRGKRR